MSAEEEHHAWLRANFDALSRELEELRALLERRVRGEDGAEGAPRPRRCCGS